MAKYYIISYEKKEQSILAALNTMYVSSGINEYSRGIQEPYEIKLRKEMLWGMIKIEVIKNISLPRGFNHIKELKTGREYVGKKR